MYLLECWIEHPVRSLDQTFTYLSEEPVLQGCRVSIPFANRNIIGFVESCTFTDETEEEAGRRLGMKIRFINEIIDTESLITDELHDLAFWMKDQTLSSTISCFQVMLPQKAKPVSGFHKAVKVKWVRVSDNEISLTPKQLSAYLYVQKEGKLTYGELRKLYPNQAKALVDKGALEIYEEEKKASEPEYISIAQSRELTEAQKQVLNEIMESRDRIFLLKGITGSGKTEIYLQAAAQALSEGKQVLILVPEISLTPQMIERVSSRFPAGLAIYHSGLNAQQKYEQYRLVKSGEAGIVVGTRSAVFLPFTDLGLIVMDEEHDNSYKQENQPAYHARDIAAYRAGYHACKLILGSATPSLDSYARALKHVYHLVELKERINRTKPDITVVPMKEALSKGESYILSDVLKEKMESRLERNEQTILLLNRRGYHSMLRCKACAAPITCPHCDIAMSYHRDSGRMKCHTCGTEIRVPKTCSVCGSAEGFTTFGFGTQKLEEEIRDHFPSARVLRMDADTTGKKDAHRKILTSFGAHEADILLGTQMIAKGLDYPGVTLVGIINGDEGLNRTDFRSCETTFDLLMQASGRSGRGETAGEVVIQVFDPKHYAVACAVEQDYDTFFRCEMNYRHAGQYPPYTYLIAVTVTGMKKEEVDTLALEIKNTLHGDFKTIGVISLLRIHDLYRSRLVLKGKNLENMQSALRDFMSSTKSDLKGLRIDVNPLVLD